MKPALPSVPSPEMQCDALAHATPGGRRPAILTSTLRSLSLIRWDDTILLQGSPFLGALASMSALTPTTGVTLLLLLVGSTCLVAHVFLLNDWLGANGDLRDPYRTVAMDPAENHGPVVNVGLCVVVLAMSFVVFGFLGARTLVIAVAIAASSALYSGPVLHGKGIPIVSSILHLLGGSLHFLLGYSLSGTIDGRGLEIACFFGLAFAAGHLTQEVRDHDVDLRNGIATNAVAFGKRYGFAASLVLFTVADALLLTLAARGTIPRALALASALFPFQMYGAVRALQDGLSFESIRRFQVRYRSRYAVTGLAMTIAFLLTLPRLR